MSDLEMQTAEWQVTVQRPQVPGDRGYVQIDDVSGGENHWSKGPAQLRAEGYHVPDFSRLPTGRYTWAEAQSKVQRLTAESKVQSLKSKVFPVHSSAEHSPALVLQEVAA